jgi:hypothetical protein
MERGCYQTPTGCDQNGDTAGGLPSQCRTGRVHVSRRVGHPRNRKAGHPPCYCVSSNLQCGPCHAKDEDDTMSSSIVITAADTPTEPIAPWRHTVLVLLPIAIGSVASWYQHGLPNANLPGMSSRLSGYFTVIAEEWVVVLLIWLALRRRGLSIGSLVSVRSSQSRDGVRAPVYWLPAHANRLPPK